ncbi:hypothetical protein AVEN_83148-1 [Araneus ventricosus]|uniref:Uncharacterized protein n=1 Tax=Araneus ventricosus TaxID=182803 RepID=A0A4Y2APX8_ARAVE|nr:hypothetical protein AVEN_83148-1 [Araneus ventricosus]
MRRKTPELATANSKLPHHISGRTFGTPAYDVMCIKPTNMTDLQWNQVSNLEPSGPEAETLSLSHRGQNKNGERMALTFR